MASDAIKFHFNVDAVEQKQVAIEMSDIKEVTSDEEEARVALLLIAAAKNNVAKVKNLLAGGMSPDAADYDYRSALHLAASEGRAEVVRVLLEHGANVNVVDRFGSTPLDDAIHYGHEEVVALLRAKGAKGTKIDKFQADLIQAAHDNDVEEAERLIRNGVSPNCCDYDKRTPLHLAVAEGHLAMVQLLLAKGANAEAEDRWGITPIYEANRRSTRTGADPIKDAFSSFQQHAHVPFLNKFSLFFGFWEIMMIVLLGIFMDYSEFAGGHSDPASPENTFAFQRIYPMFQDVHVMIFVGFGFLMTFLRKNGYNSVGLTFLIGAFAIQWFLLTACFWEGVFAGAFHNLKLEVSLLCRADFAAGAVLITYGAVLGKVSPSQILFVTISEVFLYSLNETIGLELKIADLGGTQTIHQFGALFGLALSLAMTPKKAFGNPNNAAVYHADLFAMIGTVFLWMYWPSFNGALGQPATQHRAVINTYMSMSGSCVGAFIASYVFRAEAKFNMVDIQNATLAGGVIMGAACDMIIYPGTSCAIGFIGGLVSVFGFVHVQPFLESKLGLHDTCGVNNLHGMPSILGGFVGVIAASQATVADYGVDQLLTTFPHRNSRTANRQAAIQFAYMCITAGIALAGGFVTGYLVKLNIFEPRVNKGLFMDDQDWEVPELETPYYFDHRGEISRDANGLGREKDNGEGEMQSKETSRALPAAVEAMINDLQSQITKLKTSKAPAPAPAAAAFSPEKMELVFDKILARLEKV